MGSIKFRTYDLGGHFQGTQSTRPDFDKDIHFPLINPFNPYPTLHMAFMSALTNELVVNVLSKISAQDLERVFPRRERRRLPC